jgi:protein-disulfide isomerase
MGRIALITLAASLLLVPGSGLAQNNSELLELRKGIESLKESQTAILERLKALEALMKQGLRPSQAPAQEAGLVLRGAEDDPFTGGAEAELVLIEFSDYQCPYCRRHFKEILPQLKREYLEGGKVKYVFRDFPLDSMHPHAAKAAEAANCAGDQGKYWEMHQRLFENARALGPVQLPDHAKAVGLDMTQFTECLDGGKYTDEVKQDVADGRAAGVTGTPTFFLAVAGDEPGTLKTLKRIVGAQPFDVFKAAIDEALSELSKGAVAKGEGG